MLKLMYRRCRGNERVFDGKWEGGDSERAFSKNRKKHGKSWFWREYPVTYTYNSQKYRCPEFDTINWEESVIILGCSFTFGTGVSDEHTISSQLTNLGWPTVNLGQPGTGTDYQFFNSIILNENKIKPRAVIYNWPTPARMLQWTQNDRYILWGPWNTNSTDWGWHYISSNFHALKTSLWHSRAVKTMWDCPVIEVTRNADLSKNSKDIVLLPDFVDYGRDYDGDTGHPGPETNLIFANLLAELLSKSKQQRVLGKDR